MLEISAWESDVRRALAVPLGAAESALRSRRAMLVGLGNIGSFAAGMLAPLVRFLRLVDRDRVEDKNRWNQSYRSEDAGRFKVDAVADDLRRRFPWIEIETFAVDVEDLPEGNFRDVDFCLGALDSLLARQVVSERCVRHACLYIDGGVGEPLLGRVQTLFPRDACLQCSWGPEHYRQLAAEYRCRPGGAGGDATSSPSLLGAVVGSLMVVQAIRCFSDNPPRESHDVFVDWWAGRFLQSRLRRSDCCRFDHQTIDLVVDVSEQERKRYDDLSAADLLAAASRFVNVEDVVVEARRGLLAGPRSPVEQGSDEGQHWVVPGLRVEDLRIHASVPLAQLGLQPRDGLTFRSMGTGPSLFLTWSRKESCS